MDNSTERPIVVFADDGLNVFASLGELLGCIEAIDVENGEYRAIFTVDGEIVEAVALDDTNVRLTVTDKADGEDLRRRLRAHAHQFESDPDDPHAVATEKLRARWEHRWPKRPRWLDQRLHGDGPREA